MEERSECKLCHEEKDPDEFPLVTHYGLPILLQGCCAKCILELHLDFVPRPDRKK